MAATHFWSEGKNVCGVNSENHVTTVDQVTCKRCKRIIEGGTTMNTESAISIIEPKPAVSIIEPEIVTNMAPEPERTFAPVETVPVSHEFRGETRIFEDKFAIINSDTGRPYSMVTGSYEILTHEEALKHVDMVLANNPQLGTPSLNINMYPDHTGNPEAKMKAVYTFPDVQYEVENGDLINPTITILNSYDLSWAYKVLFGAYRLVCTNGMVVGEKFLEYRKEHHQDINLERISELLIQNMERMSDQIGLWHSWLDRVTTSSEYERIVRGIGFNKTQLEEIHEEVEVSSNVRLDDFRIKSISYWVLFNLITQYITHRVENPVKQHRLNGRVRQLFY